MKTVHMSILSVRISQLKNTSLMSINKSKLTEILEAEKRKQTATLKNRC